MSERVAVTGRTRDIVIFIDKLILVLSRHWLLVFNTFWGLYLALAVLAPILMALGMNDAGQSLYRFFANQCHQLPQRSYYLFGQAGGVQSYSLDQVLTWGAVPGNMRAFVGNSEIGFKIAIAHRLLAVHVSLFVGGLLWGVIGKRLPRLSLLGYGLLILPMILDGGSHILSEISGSGFRESNTWAVWLTGGIFPSTFYTGTTLGSLNWLLRTVTGTLFGLATIWFGYPRLEVSFAGIRHQLETKLQRAGVL
jgi:uncharacterized membrane protein